MPKQAPRRPQLPQQENDPRERRDKAAPPSKDRKPLFPNQQDPPPQRPWPATSDEGNSVPPPAPRSAP